MQKPQTFKIEPSFSMPIQFITYHRTVRYPQTKDVYVLTFDEFARHVDLIKSEGISVAQHTEAFTCTPKQLLCITFDDGCKSDLINAELLARKKLTAMFFISTANIGKHGYLNEDEIRELQKLGMSIGSHSHDHLRLNTMPMVDAVKQMSQSKLCLEEITKHSIDAIAFPGGGYNRETIRAAREVNFRYLLTTDWGINTFAKPVNSFVIKRNNILTNMSEVDYVRLITFQSQYRRQLTFVAKQTVRALLPEAVYKSLRRWIK